MSFIDALGTKIKQCISTRSFFHVIFFPFTKMYTSRDSMYIFHMFIIIVVDIDVYDTECILKVSDYLILEYNIHRKNRLVRLKI